MATNRTQGHEEDMTAEEYAGRDNVTKSHVYSLREFVTNLNTASENILKVEHVYNRVAALVTYWEDKYSDRKHLKEHGRSLWKLLKTRYKFEVGEEPFELPGNRDEPNRHLVKKIDDIVFEGRISSGTEHNLFVLYYGGHATSEFGGASLWMPKIKGSMSIDWHSVQDVLKDANCDILFLFDCCYGGAMINPKHKWKKRCELLTSCPPSSDASGVEQESFTRALVCEMESELQKHKRCDVYMLHNNLNSKRSRDKYNLTRDPTYLSHSKRAGVSISLQPLHGSGNGSAIQPLKPEEMLGLSEARVLFKISFSNPDHLPVLEEWEDFVRHRPSNITRMEALVFDSRRPSTVEELVRTVTSLHCLFETHSNVAIMSVPVWLWDLLPRQPLIEYIAIVRSQNLIENLPEMFTGEDRTAVAVDSAETHKIGQSLMHTPGGLALHYADQENEFPSQESLQRREPSTFETRSLDYFRRDRGPRSRYSAPLISRDLSSHVPELPTMQTLTRSRGSRPRTPPSVSTEGLTSRLSQFDLSANFANHSYQSLDNGQFRLIWLQPGRKDDFDDIVRCQIFHFTLSDPRPYIALSYAWGDVSDKRKILVENIFITVSASLESALRTLRGPRESRWVWADALCINQQDASEKAEQVRLMTRIYQQAESVAIWLGPRSKDSDLGMKLIEKISNKAEIPREITSLTPEPFSEQNFAAVVALFEREYWHRLWVVQEVFNARVIYVHCGSSVLPWEAFRAASVAFWKYRDVLDRNFDARYSNNFHHARFGSYPQVLVHGGPRSLEGISTLDKFKDCDAVSDHEAFRDLLTVMRTCRPKQTSDPRDKIFGILGVLLEKVRNRIEVNYGIPVKDVYTNVFRTVVEKTKSLEILCDSIHSPTYSNKNDLPSWTPDWSHRLLPSPISTMHPGTFLASGHSKAVADFTERNKLKVSAIPLGTVKDFGVAVGTRCTLNDYLMAFLQWRACLLQATDGGSDDYLRWLQQRFCLALSLDQTPGYKKPEDWMDICYHVIACLIRDRLPKLHMDQELEQYTEKGFQMDDNKRRRFLQDHLGSNMMGRRFCITNERRVGLGTGSMTRGDIVVIPLGCSTPVILHPEGDGYRFVGDVYIHGYMYGRAVEECDAGDSERQVKAYVIH